MLSHRSAWLRLMQVKGRRTHRASGRVIGRWHGCLIGIPCINTRIGFNRDAWGGVDGAVLIPGPLEQRGALVPLGTTSSCGDVAGSLPVFRSVLM